MMDSESHPRPRRTRHDSAKHYDAKRKDLELSQVLDVLQCYVDYGGGINCCVCGKLYKSRVCFTKHLWEHTVYWDQFAGDKNHMRVLSIQAALILYGTCQQRPIPVDSLLVTSPHASDHGPDGKAPQELSSAAPKATSSGTPRKASSTVSSDSNSGVWLQRAVKMLPTTPERKSSLQIMPKTPAKKTRPTILKSSHKRKAPPKLDLGTPSKKKAPPVALRVPSPAGEVRPANSPCPSPLGFNRSASLFFTPIKQGIPCIVPRTPKKAKKRLVTSDTVCHHASRKVSRFFVPTSDVSSNDPCWKEAGSCVCKRKRAE